MRRALAELGRVLAPGGKLALGYTGAEKMAKYPDLSQGFTLIEPGEVEGALRSLGFVEVRTHALDGPVTTGDFVTTASMQT